MRDRIYVWLGEWCWSISLVASDVSYIGPQKQPVLQSACCTLVPLLIYNKHCVKPIWGSQLFTSMIIMIVNSYFQCISSTLLHGKAFCCRGIITQSSLRWQMQMADAGLQSFSLSHTLRHHLIMAGCHLISHLPLDCQSSEPGTPSTGTWLVHRHAGFAD